MKFGGQQIVRLLGVFGFRREGLAGAARRGAVWTVAEFGTQSVLRLASTLILTRLLTPDDFGLMSLASVFLAGVALLSDIGTTPSVIRSKRGADETFLRTAWTIQALRGVAIMAVTALLAWPISLIYDEPLLLPLIALLALTALLDGFASISVPLARRQMVFARLTLMSICVQVITISATVFFAWKLESVWALVIGTLIGSTIKLVLTYAILPPFRPAFRLEGTATREIITFGRWILLGTILTFLVARADRVFFGVLVPIDVLGLIAIAETFGQMLRTLTGRLLSNIAFPALSKQVRENPSAVKGTLFKVQLSILATILPMFLALSWLAQDLIALMYDPRYLQAGAFLALMALNEAFSVLSMPYQNTLLAAGNSRGHALVMGCWATMRVGGIVIGFQLGGLTGVFIGIALAGIFALVVSATLAHRRGLANPGLDITAVAILVAAYILTLEGLFQ